MLHEQFKQCQVAYCYDTACVWEPGRNDRTQIASSDTPLILSTKGVCDTASLASVCLNRKKPSVVKQGSSKCSMVRLWLYM